MSSGHNRGSSMRGPIRGNSMDATWSDWAWNADYQCDSRYRQNAAGEWEYEYREGADPNDFGDRIPRNTEDIQDSFLEGSLDHNYPFTQPAGTNTDFAISDADPSDYQYDSGISAPANYASLASLNYSPHGKQTTVASYNAPNAVRTQDPKAKVDQDPTFKLHRSRDFKFGRIFKVLWSEPAGSGGTEITERSQMKAKYGEKAFQSIRRFLVVDDSKKGHCICLPILTYGGRGTLKHGVHPDDHALIYTSKNPPRLLTNEHLVKKAIRVDPINPSLKLDPASRLNYAKAYTVEHNVKVQFIGQVAKRYEQQIIIDYNNTHMPLPKGQFSRSLGEASEHTFSYADGREIEYPAAGEERNNQNYEDEESFSAISNQSSPTTYEYVYQPRYQSLTSYEYSSSDKLKFTAPLPKQTSSDFLQSSYEPPNVTQKSHAASTSASGTQNFFTADPTLDTSPGGGAPGDRSRPDRFSPPAGDGGDDHQQGWTAGWLTGAAIGVAGVAAALFPSDGGQPGNRGQQQQQSFKTPPMEHPGVSPRGEEEFDVNRYHNPSVTHQAASGRHRSRRSRVRDETLKHENLTLANQAEEQPKLKHESINSEDTSFEPPHQEAMESAFPKLEGLGGLAEQVDVKTAPTEGVSFSNYVEENLYDASESENDHQAKIGNIEQQNNPPTTTNHESQNEVSGKSTLPGSTPGLDKIREDETPISTIREDKVEVEALLPKLESFNMNTPGRQSQDKEAIIPDSHVSKDNEVEDQSTSLPSRQSPKHNTSGNETGRLSRPSSTSSVRSLQSLDSTVNNYSSSYSSNSSWGSLPEYVERLRDFLLDDTQLQALFEEATQKVSFERFEKNFKRCLQQFSKHLQKEATSQQPNTPLLVEASKVVYKYSGNAAHLIRRTLERCVTRAVNSLEPRENETSTDPQDDVDNTQESEAEDTDGEIEENSKDFSQLEVILKESNAFEMLRDNFRLFLRPSSTERAVFEAWPSKLPKKAHHEITHNPSWELPALLRSDFYGHSIRRVLTLTGREDDAYASSCEEYLMATWPEMGSLLLNGVDEFLITRDETHVQNVLTGASIQIWTSGELEGPRISTAKFVVKANYSLQVQATEAISWLCSAFRLSSHENLWRSSVAINAKRISDTKSTQKASSVLKTIEYTLRPLEIINSSTACWHPIFPHGVLAYGFPIPERKEGYGLEISFADMAVASRCLSFMEFDGGLIANGLTSILIPMAKLPGDDDAVQWHLVDKMKRQFNQHLRFSEIMESINSKKWYKVLRPETLVNRRCFLGLSEIANIVIGTQGYKAELDYSTAEESPTVQRVQAQQFTIGPGCVGYTSSTNAPLELTASIHSIASAQNDNDIYWLLSSAKDHLVLLYDTEQEIGYYIPQVSVALHMIHATTSMQGCSFYEGGKRLSKEKCNAYSRAGPDGWATASYAIKSGLGSYTDSKTVEQPFGDLFRQVWLTLDIIEGILASKELDFRNATTFVPNYIHGVEYVDAVNRERPPRLAIKNVRVNQAWAHLTTKERIVLFSQTIPPPIIPEAEYLCPRWSTVPLNRGYLVIMGANAARSFLKKQKAGLAKGLYWNFEGRLIQSHGQSNDEPVFHVQRLGLHTKPCPNEPILKAIAECQTCCLVFGNDSESEEECPGGFEDSESSSPEEMNIQGTSNAEGQGPDPQVPDATAEENATGSESSQDTDQTSILCGSRVTLSSNSSLISPVPELPSAETSPFAAIRMKQGNGEDEGESTSTRSRSGSGGLGNWRKVKSKSKSGKYPGTSGYANGPGSLVPRGARAEALPRKLSLERRMIEDDTDRRENMSTKTRERT